MEMAIHGSASLLRSQVILATGKHMVENDRMGLIERERGTTTVKHVEKCRPTSVNPGKGSSCSYGPRGQQRTGAMVTTALKGAFSAHLYPRVSF